MKKANIIFSCIGILSVIGSALAFKAQHKFGGTLFCYTSGPALTPVPTSKEKYKITTADIGATMFCTAPFANAYKRLTVRGGE